MKEGKRMKKSARRLAALLLVFAMMLSTSLTAWAAPQTQDAQTQSAKNTDASDATVTIDKTDDGQVKDALEGAIFQSREADTIDVSDCNKSEAEMTALTDEVLEENNSDTLVDITYKTDAKSGNVSSVEVERDEALVMAMDELDAINKASAEPKSDEQMQDVYKHYASLQECYEAHPDYWGLPVNYFTDKDTEASPVGAILSMMGKTEEEVNIQELDGTIQGIQQGLEAYVQNFGPALLAARDKALECIDESMSDEEKLLALHDYVAKQTKFDLGSILDIVDGTSNGSDLIKSTTFGAMLGADVTGNDHSVVCLGYAATYGYLVQCAFPEIYKDEEGEWKTKDEVKDDYMVDYVMIKYDHTTDFGGSTIHFNSPHYFNAIKLHDKWYYVDACYDDVNQEVMDQKRVENDGDCSHMFFLVSDTEMRQWYDGNYELIDTGYQDLATNTDYESYWSQYAYSTISYDDTNWYYVKGAFNKREQANDQMSGDGNDYGDMGDFGDGDYGDIDMDQYTDKLVMLNRSNSGGEPTVLFNYNNGEVTGADGTAVVNEQLAADCEKDQAYQEIYPNLRHCVGLYNNKLYFNLANKVYSLDLETREVVKVKEYNDVYAASDGNRLEGSSYYSVPADSDQEIKFKITDHPVGGLCIKDDGVLYTSILTNYSFVSDPRYAYEETNYDAQSYTYGDEEDANKEFSWCANVRDTMELSHLESNGTGHNYVDVTVAPTCTEAGFTESRCETCGKSANNSKTETGEAALGHHYVYDAAESEESGEDVYICTRCYDVESTAPEGTEEKHVCAAPTFQWDETNHTCTATFACDEDEHGTRIVNCAITKKADKNCTEENAKIVYTATAYDVTGKAYTNSDHTVPVSEHSYGDPVFTWAQDYSSCTAKMTCELCGDVVEDTNCEITREVITAPGCTTSGSAKLIATAMLNGEKYTDESPVFQIAPAHVFGAPTFAWTEIDGAPTCQATFTCVREGCGQTETKDCEVKLDEENSVAPTCTAAGKNVYVASIAGTAADGSPKTYTDSKDVEVPATGHTYGEPTFQWADDRSTCTAVFTCTAADDTKEVACENITHETTKQPTCGEEGVETYTATVEFNGKTYTGTATTALAKTDNHQYGEPTFNWTDDFQCTLDVTCSVCGDKKEPIECEVTSEITKQPTCQEEGAKLYTATAVYEGQELTNTKTETLAKTAHAYGEPVFKWAADYSTCAADYTCSVCQDIHTENCTVTHDTTPATCTENGSAKHTATVTFDGKDSKDVKNVTLDATGHTYGEPTFNWNEDKSACTATFTCEKGDDTQTKDCTVTTEVEDSTCIAEGKTIYTATIDFAGKTYTDTKETAIAKKAHTYGEPNFKWSEDKTACTAEFTCSVCGDKQTVNCDVKNTAEGAYEATCEFEGKTYTATYVSINGISLNKQSMTLNVGTSETLTVTFNPENATEDKTVTWTTSNAAVATVDNGKVTGVAEGTATITATSSNGKTATCEVTVKKTPINEIFTDVKSNDWFFKSVQYVYDNSIMSGTSATTFSPNTGMNRAMVVQTLYNMAGKPEVTGDMPFTDVKKGDWYYNAVLWASQEHVAAGTSATTFAPTAKVNREQFAQFLYNDAGKPEVTGTLNFPDSNKVSDWAQNAILWANQNGIVNGKPVNGKTLIDPQGLATRAEAASMLMNYVENVKNKAD